MEYIRKQYSGFLDYLFETKSTKTITKDYCYICNKTCNQQCECRCHVPSCIKCDKKNCEYKLCKCKCHKKEEKEIVYIPTNPILANGPQMGTNPIISNGPEMGVNDNMPNDLPQSSPESHKLIDIEVPNEKKKRNLFSTLLK